MGRELRGIRGKEAIRAFIKVGGQLRSGKGDHINIKMPNGMIVTIPGRKELKIGLLKNAIQKANLTIENFLELLQEVIYLEYTIIIHEAEEGGYWAEIPVLPGCYSQGETIEETLANTKEAVESHLIALKEEKHRIPKETMLTISRIEVPFSRRLAKV